MSAALASYLPKSEGLLGYWQLFVAATAFFNSVQNFVTLKLTRRIYDSPSTNVTSLQARTFAIWTLTSGIVRLYAAYNIHNKVAYDMAMFTYLIAFGHFVSEWSIFHSTSFKGIISPFIVSSTTLIWMFNQYNFYVRA